MREYDTTLTGISCRSGDTGDRVTVAIKLDESPVQNPEEPDPAILAAHPELPRATMPGGYEPEPGDRFACLTFHLRERTVEPPAREYQNDGRVLRCKDHKVTDTPPSA